MSQMAGFDFSVVTPRGRALSAADLEAEQQMLLEAARQAQWDSGPVPEQNLDIAPEAGAPIVLGPNALVEAADAAMSREQGAGGMEQGVEPPLPVAAPEGAPGADRRFEISNFRGEEPGADRRLGISDLREDEPLPPVTAEAGLVEGYDFSNVTARPTPDGGGDRRLEISDFKSEEKAEIKLPAPKPTPKPVATPEAADGSDVTFKKDGPAFQFTGSLVVDPETGPMATDPLKRAPRLRPEGGQIVFDTSSPERFTQGVEDAFAKGLLPTPNYEKIKTSQADIFKVVQDRKALEEKAQADPRLLAVLQGLGRGGAMTAGAVGGAKVGAAGGAAAAAATGVGVAAIPIVAAVTGTAGAIAGGIGAGLGYDALYKTLGEHFEQYDNVMKAAELYPMHRMGGELSMAALALPVSAAQGARGLQTAYQAGGLPQAARTAGVAGGLGAGTGVVAYPIDAAARGQEITPGGFAAAAGVGALTGGFFINNRMANAKDVAAVAAKMKAGQTLTAAETQLVRAAQPEMAASIARMDAAGGVRTGPLDVEVPVTSVVGLVPSAGRARVNLPFSVPARLPAGAVRAAQARAEAPRLPAAAAAGDGAATPGQPSVPREAPVNVLPTGPEVIPMPGPAVVVSRAMLTPDAFVDAMAAERGLDMDFNPTATEELFAEHFELVKAAVSNNEPVSAAAMDLYEMRVPYYARNEETGVATYDAAAFKAYEDYLMGRDREFSQDMTEMGGVELLAAVIELGGLPSRQAARSRRSAWSGELEMLLQNAQGAGKGKGSDNQKGVFLNKLFRKDGKDLDDIVTGLRGKGFRVETPAELIEMLDVRLRTGNEVFGVPTQGMEDVPLEMRGARRGAETAGGGDAAATTPVPRVEERPDLTLAPPDPQAYFDFSNVPASKQPAGNAAVQAAVQASDQPYQAAPVSAAGGVAGDVGLADARSRQAAAYRALLAGDNLSVALAIEQGVPLSRLMLGYISREPASFNIKGAIIKSPQDLAMYNLAHRTPFFESLKIAVLDDRQQVIHSQVVSVGTLNESLAHPRDFAAVVLAAQQANPQAKLAGFMIMHNHPSGQTDPSEADRAITRRFEEVGDMIGLPLLDHVITNGESYFSFVEGGLTYRNPASSLVADDPTMPVLPAAPGMIAPGQMAPFEAAPASAAQQLRMGMSDSLLKVQQTLQTADPNMIHVINVDTRYGILNVVRHPMDVKAAEVMKATTPAGAYAMMMSLPNMMLADAQTLVREVRKASDLMQIRLLDAVVAGMPDTFAQRGLLEQPDAPYAAERKVAEVGPDPLTPPSSVRSGGPAKVPPGTPVGMAAINPPEWVTGPGETSAGRRIIKGIENFRPGQRWGFRSIVDFVNEAVRLEMRRSTSQTTRTHPAHYKPAHHMAYTRETQSQINFHEAGHGLEYLIRARVPDFFNAYADELLALANRPGSMASDAPTALSKEAQRQYRIGEGVAEWTRLLMVDPGAVQNLKVTAALEAVAERFYPGMAKSLRDGARAVNAFQAADVATRWAMFNAVPGANPSANELIGAIVRGGESAVNMIASGAPVSALDRKITRAIIKQRKETETAYGAAVKKARETRATNLTPLMSAYNMILSIGAETQLAISGQSISKGLRIVEDDGSFRYLTHETWRDLRKKVPATKLAQFDQAAWAKESLNRWENGGLEYPGMREGISPADLKAIVAAAEREIANFTGLYKEQSRFQDLILEVKEAGGLISGMDRAMMQSARDGYWPLPRVMTAGRGRGGRGRGDISAGVFKARGSGEAIRNIDEVTEERTREMYEAYYWNRFGTKLYDNMLAVAKDKSLPAEARKLAGATMVKLKMPMQSAAKVSKEEALGWVMKAIGDAYERALGFRPEVKAEDINLSWNFRDVWRPVKPTDVNVVSLLRDGKREYYQIGDPAMFALFSRPQEARAAGKFVSWAVGPMTENWKRNITQGPVFAVRNMFRDVFTQPMMNPDPVGWVPGWSHWKGAVNKWTQKHPQVFSEGLLLSRVEPAASEMVNSVKHGAVWQWLTEGFYVSQAKDPIVRTLATVLNPSNFLFPLWKTVDLVNLVTGGRTLARFFETAGREGAAVAALERGATDEEALAKYWTAAGQFNEHAGNADARIMMRIPGFLNPMLQGLRNQVQKLTDPDPAVAGTTWLRLLAMMPVAFGGAAIARYLFMDEKEKAAERQRPVDERMNFMDLGGFSIPFPFGVEGVMGSVVYNATMDDLLSRPKVDADRTALMLLKRIADPGSALQFFGPQLATLTEANMNWSTFRQKHIVAPWMVNLPASEQYYSTTPEFYRKLGTMMNYSPAKLQYVVQQAISRQADETIRLAESLDRGRPIMEAADVPFVGRMFVRDPIGFGSQAVRSAAAVEDKLRLLDERLKSKGWASLKDPTFDADQVGSVELRKLQVQLAYLEDLRKGLRVLSDMQGVGKYYTLARDYANERNVRTAQTRYAQSLLIGNRDQMRELELALELVKQIPQAPPEQVAAEYLDRRF